MKNKVLIGALITSIGLGGVVYANTDINKQKQVSSVDYKVENKIMSKEKDTIKSTDKVETKEDISNSSSNTYPRGCYGMGRNHRRLTDEELKELRESGNFSYHLGISKEEYDNLTEKERKELFNRVKENRNLSDSETEKLLTSGSYCHYYDMTEEEYKKLTDAEKEELFKNDEYGGYRHYRRHNNYVEEDSEEDTNYRNNSHHRRGFNRRGHNRRGYCH